MDEPDMMGKMMIVGGLFILILAFSHMCGCTAPGRRYWEEPCHESVKNLGLNAPEGDGETAWHSCKPLQQLELLVLGTETLAVCRCPHDYLIDAGAP